MKLRDFKNTDEQYDIGLDIGMGSVGWAVTDGKGELCRFKGKHTWGSRIFSSAEQAAEARIHRGQRRRYIRRRWRLDLLQTFFQDAMEEVDPDFFIRLHQSRLLKEDRAEGHREYLYPLFNDPDFTEVDYYNEFPTIYHLRAWLMETAEKADIRLVYLALHNIVKHRGNFLRQGEKLSAKDANTEKAIERLSEALQEWCAADELDCGMRKNAAQIRDVLEANGMSRSERRDEIAKLLDLGKEGDTLDGKKLAKAIAGAMVGLKAEMKDIFPVEVEGTKIELSNDEQVESFLTVLPSEGEELFEAMRAAYSSFVLGGLLSFKPGETISYNKIAEYEKYGDDLKLLKAMVKTYVPESYDDFFRGPCYKDKQGNDLKIYDKTKAHGYTRYDLGVQASSYDAFAKEVEKLFSGTAAEQDSRYAPMIEGFKEQRFLRRLKTSDNGSIPYQLHLEEMRIILKNQGRHYPFLLENADKIETLITFRIPYYVGPLSLKNAPLETMGKDDGCYRFAWATRKAGHEDDAIKPWNWDEIIDTHASAEAFIKRMVGMCTYVQGAEVLPRESLLYEEYCVLNELNGSRWSQDGDDEHRFTSYDTHEIMDDLFRKQRGKVSYRRVQDWLACERGATNARVLGGQGETGYESKLSSYRFFCETLNVEALSAIQYDMAENIILWSTLFEDRSILKEKVCEAYGDMLSSTQIKKICKKRFTGWGKLSREFLCGIKVPTDDGMKSVMDVLREGHPSDGQRSRVMVLMEITRDDDLGFEKKIDERNKEYARECGFQLEDIPGSPALRRGVNQAIRIVEEIAGIAGKPPANIYIEVTRGEDNKRPKGSRTKRRYESIKTALGVMKKESPELFDLALPKELGQRQNELDDERLMLYFMQGGKSLYSGKALDVNDLSRYEVDHIIPRSYIKDDSLDNKALVLREENQRKLDSLLLDESIRRDQKVYWRALREAKLISEKKFNNLMRNHISEKALKGFINRQLVETSQIVKYVRLILEDRYEESKVVSIKAGISHDLREACDFVKCREANDYHHAHDAYLACQIGRFVQGRYPLMLDKPIAMTHVLKKYVRAQSSEFGRTRKTPGSAGFIVDSFCKSNFNAETGELYTEDFIWDAEKELARIRKSLNFKDCFISRMPEETRGAFWDATIYSPRSNMKLDLPLKKELDPRKYGGYSSEKFAYFFVYRSAKNGNAKNILRWAAVPVSLAAKVEADNTYLSEYARELAERDHETFVAIVREKVFVKQLVEVDGSRLFVTGRDQVRNAVQPAFEQDQMRVIKTLVEGKHVDSEKLDSVYWTLVEKTEQLCPRLFDNLRLSERASMYERLKHDEKEEITRQLLAVLTANRNMVDLRPLGGAATAGQLKITFSKEMMNQGITFIDQSVTGMFERRTRIGF